jgi:hypothetical protein
VTLLHRLDGDDVQQAITSRDRYSARARTTSIAAVALEPRESTRAAAYHGVGDATNANIGLPRGATAREKA